MRFEGAGIRANLLSARGLAWSSIMAGLAAWLCFVPLFDLLGYAFSLAVAAAASLGAAHLGSALVARTRETDEALLLATSDAPRALLVLVARGAAIAGALLLLPLALIALNALRVRNCDPLTGLAFFLLMPVAGAALAALVGTLWGLLVPRAAAATSAALATVLAFWAWALWQLYDSPAIFFHDPFIGFFPGSIYDEDLAVRTCFIVYRAHTMLWAVGAVALAALFFEPGSARLRLGAFRFRPRAAAIAAGALAAAVTLCLLGAELGFRGDAALIRRELGAVRRTAHFDIFHPAEFSPEAVDLLAQDHEFRHAQLSALLGAPPRGRIRSYVFASSEQKRRLMGAGRTLIAKPWRREIYLHQMGFPHPVLKHELAHVFAAAFGDPVFGASIGWRTLPAVGVPRPNLNFGLIEGLAVAADWPAHGESTIHEQAAALERIGLAPPLAELMGPRFLVHAGGRAYTAAGSFCRFLIDVHPGGISALRAAYRSGGRFTATHGEPLSSLVQRWTRWLRALPLPPREIELARERFRRPSIFARTCPHALARLDHHAQQLQRQRRHADAAGVRERICRFEPDDPGHLLDWSVALRAAGDVGAAERAARSVLEHRKTSAALARLAHESRGDLRWTRGDLAGARAAYRRARGLAAAAPRRRLLRLKSWALDQPSVSVRELLLRYLVDDPGTLRDGVRDVHLAHELHRALLSHRDRRAALPEPAGDAPRAGLGLYLAARQLAERDHCREAVAAMREALRRGLPDVDFLVEAQRTLGSCQYRLGDLLGARETFLALQALADLPGGVRLRAADWLQRVGWRLSGRLPPPLLAQDRSPPPRRPRSATAAPATRPARD